MGFPQLSNIAKNFVDTINSRTGNNVKASGIMPWIRVTSTLGDFLSIESISGTETFAQKYGNTERSGRIGVNKNKESVFAENDNRGFRPSPTINSVSVSQGNEGLSKKISFTIVAYSLGQTELIMEYFLEPGNMCLVEWGENTSLSVSQKADFTTNDICEVASYNNIKYIQDKRAESNGTYDAVLGNITGGDVKFGSNETYEINVELTSIGETPAYLQHHKNIVSDIGDTKDTGLTFSKTKIDTTSDKEVGKALFMQMFNDLPLHKRTEEVKNLENEKWAIDQGNFINIDSEIKEKYAEGLGGKNVNTSSGSVEIPSDIPIFSDKRFIRCALAFTILEMQPDIDTISKKICDTATSVSGKIRWQNTICRAHRHMFSADSDFLYIPNKTAPNFDLIGATQNTGSFTNPIPDFKSLEESKFQADLHPLCEVEYSYFPNNNNLFYKDSAVYNNQAIPYEADAGEWGFLKDLYINFDFFIDCLNSSGLVTKEVWYKILNGLSSAVNLYWDFQIIERGRIVDINKVATTQSDTDISSNVPVLLNQTDEFYNYYLSNENPILNIYGVEELQIVDASFIGKTPNGLGKAKFQSRGLQSPFLECSFNLDIPGAMKGQVIGNKLSGKNKIASNPNSEQKELELSGLFTDKIDTVLDTLNPIGPNEKNEITEENDFERRVDEYIKEKGWDSDSPSTRRQVERYVRYEIKKENKKEAEDNKKSNFEMFVGNSTIIPKIQDRNSVIDLEKGFFDVYSRNDTNLEDFAVVAAWNNPALLKVVQRYDDGLSVASQSQQEVSEATQKNVPLLPIKFDFTVHGISGIIVGNTFNIKDLPLKYKEYIFQVTEVEHSISQNIWTTKVTGQFRQMRAVIDEEPTEYVKQ